MTRVAIPATMADITPEWLTAALRANGHIQLMAASRKVQGTRSPGQGCVIAGSGEIVTEGEYGDLVREKFPWARGALVVRVESVATQL